MIWLVAAILSAVFAGLTSILAKCGIKKTDSDLATALRTIVVLAFSWIMVLVVGSVNTITTIEPKSLIFLILSGLATGASWICYFKALSVGDINKVVPIDKSSTILTVLLAIVCFGETANLAVKLIATAILAVGNPCRRHSPHGREKANRPEKRTQIVDDICHSFCRIRSVDFRSCQSRYFGCGVQPRHGNPNGSCACDGVGYRICKG